MSKKPWNQGCTGINGKWLCVRPEGHTNDHTNSLTAETWRVMWPDAPVYEFLRVRVDMGPFQRVSGESPNIDDLLDTTWVDQPDDIGELLLELLAYAPEWAKEKWALDEQVHAIIGGTGYEYHPDS